MRITGITAALLAVLLLTLGACAGPATTATTAPVALVPASITPAAAEVVPEPACPLPALEAAPGEWHFAADPIEYTIEVTPASGQMNYLLSRLLVFPVEAEVGDNLTFSVVVTNTGIQPANYTVALKSAGAVINTLDVTIDGGSSRNVELDSTAKFGEFKVVAGELTAGFRVFF